MTVTVSVNDRTVIHKASNGYTFGSPDVCLTPKSGDPAVYTNYSFSKDAAATATSVFCDGNGVVIKRSFIAQSYGDEPGKLGGVISGCTTGKTSFITASPDVFIEGEPVPRTADLSVGNHGSPPNVLNQPWIQFLITLANALANQALLCVVVCGCANNGKMYCFKRALGTGFWSKMPNSSPWPGKSVHSWDPHVPGVYIEPSFGQFGKPPKWGPVFSGHNSRNYKDSNGVGHPIPAGEWLPKTLRPDVAIAKDPSKPLTRDNIKELYEVKFTGQRSDKKQLKSCARLGVGELTELNEAECACKLRMKVRDPPMQPAPSPELDPIPHPHREVPNPERVPRPEPRPEPKPRPEFYPLPPFQPSPASKSSAPARNPIDEILKRLPGLKLQPGVLMPPFIMPKQPKPQEA